MAWTIIPDSDIDPDSPVTTGLMTALRDNVAAAFAGDSGAPQLHPSSALDDTITTEGSQSIGVGANWTPSQGLYNLVDASAISITSVLALFVSAAWRSGSSNISGLLLADGTNMRIDNVHGSTSAAVYWQRFDG